MRGMKANFILVTLTSELRSKENCHHNISNVFVFQISSSIFEVASTCLRAALIKMFSPFGKIISEDFLWHTRGPKRGESQGFAFIEYSSNEVSCLVCHFIAIVKQFLNFACKVRMQEAKLAKEKMHGKLACGRPLVVRLGSEKYMIDATNNTSRAAGKSSKSRLGGSNYGQMTRSDKIAAIKNKLRALEGEGESSSVKKQKQDNITCRDKLVSISKHPNVEEKYEIGRLYLPKISCTVTKPL